MVGEGIETATGFIFTGWPEGAQRVAGRFEALDGLRHGVALYREFCLGLRRSHQARQAAVQAGVADLAKLAEHLEIRAGLGQYAAGLEKQLVQVAVPAHAGGFQRLGRGRIATALVDAVFLIDVHRLHRQFTAQLAQHHRRLVPG